jgi:hypothetical protein
VARVQRRRARAAPVIALLIGVGLTGCRSITNEQSVSPVQHALTPGVPLPDGFTVVPGHSTGRTAGQVRYGQYEYIGRLAPGACNRWFKRYMPQGGYTLADERLEGGVYVLQFDAGDEICLIRIKPASFNRTVLDVEVGPPSPATGAAASGQRKTSQPPPGP